MTSYSDPDARSRSAESSVGTISPLKTKAFPLSTLRFVSTHSRVVLPDSGSYPIWIPQTVRF